MAQFKLQALPEGSQIGVYEIRDVISNDWSGNLYRVWNEHLNAVLALKEYLPRDYAVRAKVGYSEAASIYKYGMKKFLQLAYKLEEIQHPNVVSVYSVLKFNRTAYLVMDYVHGTPLSKILALPLSLTDANLKQILRSLLNGLDAIHNKNIVHGDIKPSNIIIKKNGEPVLVNFASATIALSEHCKQLKQIFSPHFTYKKSYHPDDLSSSSLDLYSLGVSMFYCVTGREPEAVHDRKEAINNFRLDPCHTALAQAEPSLSEELIDSILKMLNPNLEERAHSVEDVLAILDHGGDERNRLEEKILKLKAEITRTRALLFGLVVFIVLLAGLLWYSIQKTPATVSATTDNVTNIKQLVAE